MTYPPGLDFWASLTRPNDEKILLVVVDGVGGLAHPDFGGRTALEAASDEGVLPNLNAFVSRPKTSIGRVYPVARGVTPESGNGHLGLFGYNPLVYDVGRGAIEAAGAPGVPHAEVVARINFCRVNGDGVIEDRRAGRLGRSTTRGRELAAKLNAGIDIAGVDVTIVATRDHRAILAMSHTFDAGAALSAAITDTDPGLEGVPPEPCRALDPHDRVANKTASIVSDLTAQAARILSDEPDGNMILFRGFAGTPHLPAFGDVFAVSPAAIALYPLYRGVARLVGMEILDVDGGELVNEVDTLDARFDDFDFFYLHYKKPDMMGEDGNFPGKVEAIAEFDALLPRILKDDRFSVVAITGDHSTPAVLRRHSEHAVPLAIYAQNNRAYDDAAEFTERACRTGSLGQMLGVELMPLLVARAGKTRKF